MLPYSIVKTLRHSISQGTKLIFGGEIIADGNNDHFELGIQTVLIFIFPSRLRYQRKQWKFL